MGVIMVALIYNGVFGDSLMGFIEKEKSIAFDR